jgi:uncharacterized protein (TIGR02246 family)
MGDRDLHATVKAYLEAFEARDLARCLDFFIEDATVVFLLSRHQGRPAIEKWHKDRFAADLRVIRICEISIRGDIVVVDAVVTSQKLQAWKMPNARGKIVLTFQGDKIKEARLSSG